MELYEYLLSKGLKRRKSQEEFFKLVIDTIEEGGVKLIEAPTGTGKTFGYLIPIISYGQRAVISTGTKVLQDQLKRDIEFLTGHYRLITGREVNYAVLKGKGNYLCLDRYHKEDLREEEKGNIPELLDTEWDGDLNYALVEDPSRFNVDDDYCTAAYRKKCPYLSSCFYWRKLKQKELKADILIVNHSLLALREFDNTQDRLLVIDEAHELDRYLTLASRGGISLYSLREFIAGISKLYGKTIDVKPEEFFINNFEEAFKKEKREEMVLDTLEPYAEEFGNKVLNPLKKLFKTCLEDFKSELEDLLESRLMLSYELKEYLEETSLVPRELLEKKNASYDEATREEKELMEKAKKLEFLQGRLQRFNYFFRLMGRPSKEWGYTVSRSWSRKLQTFNYKMEAFPIFPRDIVDTKAYKGVILTSATVDAEDIRFTTGIEGRFYRLPHTFSYEGVSFVIEGTNPKRSDWESKLVEAYDRLRGLHEKVIVLMTNREHMGLIEDSPDTLKQGNMGLRELIERFQTEHYRVLVGVDSLWTGVDIPGEKGLLISKLPFEHPKDPITYHRLKYLEETGEDPFEYQRRKAFIRFRQGVGRLVRRDGDKGTIIFCDNRIWRYREFVNFVKELGLKVLYKRPPEGRLAFKNRT